MREYEVVIDRAAEKRLRKMRNSNRPALAKIEAAITALADDPRPRSAKPLKGDLAGCYRVPVTAPGGEYRIVYAIDVKARRVTVLLAGSREGVYD